MEKLIKTRKFNKEKYNFYLKDMIFNNETVYYISCETPSNCFGYPDTILLNSKNQAYTLHRYLQPWILNKIELIMLELQQKYIYEDKKQCIY